MNKTVWRTLSCLLLTVGCVTASAQPDQTELETIFAHYKDWANLTPHPENVSMYIYLLCTLPSPEQMAFAESEHGERYLNVFVNQTGAPTMAEVGQREFPVGTVIVKEKLLEAEATSPSALGLMIKRELGFNPEGNDWEYVYRNEQGEIFRGPERLPNCQACHLKEVGGDSVYWRGQ